MNLNNAIDLASSITKKSRLEIKKEFRPVVEALYELEALNDDRLMPPELMYCYLYGRNLSNPHIYFTALKAREELKRLGVPYNEIDYILQNNGIIDHWEFIKGLSLKALDKDFHPEYETNVILPLKIFIENLNKSKIKQEKEYKEAVKFYKKPIKELEKVMSNKKYNRNIMTTYDFYKIYELEDLINRLIDFYSRLEE